MRPNSLVEVARRTREGPEPLDHCLREFLDSFYTADEADRAAMLAEKPTALPDPVGQAILGAVAEYLARRWSCAIPAWSNEPDRFLVEPHFTTSLEGLKALLLVESPLAFRRRMIFTEAEPLRRASMPRAG